MAVPKEIQTGAGNLRRQGEVIRTQKEKQQEALWSTESKEMTLGRRHSHPEAILQEGIHYSQQTNIILISHQGSFLTKSNRKPKVRPSCYSYTTLYTSLGIYVLIKKYLLLFLPCDCILQGPSTLYMHAQAFVDVESGGFFPLILPIISLRIPETTLSQPTTHQA